MKKSMPEETPKRIYCVVAQKVQAPLNEEEVYTSNFGGVNILKPVCTEDTHTIKQPPGRIVAQHGHAVSAVRFNMLREQVHCCCLLKQPQRDTALKLLLERKFEPITTIVLSVHDSFELYHVLGLLKLAGINAHPFYDTDQPDYGDPDYRVMTAVATEPIDPEESTGVLDYLPLWKPKKFKRKYPTA